MTLADYLAHQQEQDRSRAAALGAGGIRSTGIDSQGHALQPVRGREADTSGFMHGGGRGGFGFAGGIESAACALELIHTYSLIHDDLPALDNDDLRRGRPTCHKVFGEAIAILTGDALLTLAFQVLSQLECAAQCRVRLIEELATAAGTVGGMIGGQVCDLEGEGKPPDAALLDSIHRAKTGALLRASLRMGGIYAEATEDQLNALSCFGEHVGLAFQIVDDVLDVEQSSEALGKTAGKDAQQHKITFPAVYGLERSRQMAEQQRLAAHQALRPLGGRAERLRQLADLIVQRKA